MGGRTIAEWQAAMSADEFLDWIAYYTMDPYGSYREDLRAGIIVSQLLNVHMKKGKTPLQPKDFIPRFKAGQPGQSAMTPEQILSVFTRMQGSHRG